MILRLQNYNLKDLIYIYAAAEEMDLADICDMLLNHLRDAFVLPEIQDNGTRNQTTNAWCKYI
jgi:hypothetical protein